MKSALIAFPIACILAFNATAQESPKPSHRSVTAVMDEIEAALGKKLKSFPILNLTDRPTGALIKKLADGMPGCLSSKQPILVRAKDIEFAVEALTKAADRLSRRKMAGLHIVILAPTIEPARFAALAEKTGMIFHHAQMEGG